MKKEVKLEDERIIKFEMDESTSPTKKVIEECFSIDGLECANYSIIQDDKYYFKAELDIDTISENSRDNLVYSIYINHPLFFSYYHLLNGENEIEIKDKENDLKRLLIKYDNDVITLSFIDKNKNELYDDKFKIEFDRSLDYLSNKESIKNNDLRDRLNRFFDESSELLLEDSHQISFEEYILMKKIDKKERLSS